MTISLTYASVFIFMIACTAIYQCNQKISAFSAQLTPRDKTILSEDQFKSEYFIVNALYVITVAYAITYRVYIYNFLVGTATDPGFAFFSQHAYASILLNLAIILPLNFLQLYYLLSTYRYVKHTDINQPYLHLMKLFNLAMFFYIIALLLTLILPDYAHTITP